MNLQTFLKLHLLQSDTPVIKLGLLRFALLAEPLNLQPVCITDTQITQITGTKINHITADAGNVLLFCMHF
jgi:hypothetical protein